MKFLRLLRRHKKKTIFFVLLCGVVVFGAYSLRPKPPTYEFVAVSERNILQEVSVTGRVKPDAEVSLAMETGGRVSKVFVEIGDIVEKGQSLVSVSNTNLMASLEQAQARVDAEVARLDQLRAGTRQEQIDVQKVQLANAESAYENAQKGVMTAVNDAYTKTDDAIRNKSDKFFSNPRTSSPQITFYLNDYSLENDIEFGRQNMELLLSQWNTENNTFVAENMNIATVASVKDYLSRTRTFLNSAALALSVAVPNSSVTQTAIDGYKADISLARANINVAISTVEAASDALSSAGSNVDLQRSSLALAEAPTLPETISAQVAMVEQMRASVRSIYADIDKTVLRSPISGTITKQDAKQGEIVSQGMPIVDIISKNQLQIEAFIPEADIAKVKIDDTASVTLDAYGDTINFPATVVLFDPAETIIEGVATYKTTLRFDTDDVRIKPGMTANIDILTEEKDGVLALPQRVIIRKDGKVFVQVSDSANVDANAKPREIEIEMGLRGSDGYTEIVSGLNEGDRVIVPTA